MVLGSVGVLGFEWFLVAFGFWVFVPAVFAYMTVVTMDVLGVWNFTV